MTKTEIPADVRRFILTSIPSVPHMEALMLARATAPRGWTALNLAERLYVTPGAATRVLDELFQSGMLQGEESTATYFYESRANALSGTIEQLAVLYASHLVEITVLIHSKMDRKAQQFADAFDLRRDPKDA